MISSSELSGSLLVTFLYANRMCSDMRDKEIYYIERCERLKEKNRENEKRVERLKKRLLKWEKCPNVGEAGNTGEDESLQELSDEVGNLHIREMELRAQRPFRPVCF